MAKVCASLAPFSGKTSDASRELLASFATGASPTSGSAAIERSEQSSVPMRQFQGRSCFHKHFLKYPHVSQCHSTTRRRHLGCSLAKAPRGMPGVSASLVLSSAKARGATAVRSVFSVTSAGLAPASAEARRRRQHPIIDLPKHGCSEPSCWLRKSTGMCSV